MKKYSLPLYAAAIVIAITASPTFAGADEKGHGHGGHGAMPAKTDNGHGAHGGGHGDGHHAMSPQVGEAGDAKDVRRTLRIVMKDNSYLPKFINVQAGETVRFEVMNKGEFVHEFNIGTAEMHKAHQGEMMAMMESGALEADKIVHAKMGHMKHDDPNSILLEPGQSGEVIWKFGQSGKIQFACNVPGHYESGMHGRLVIQ